LSVDTAAITGGGSLNFDPENGRYSGHLQLKIHEINVKAFGLLDTRLPGGASGFSFLILIFAEFEPPIQLGFGFGLNGVGGLVGINRKVEVPKLQEGLRSQTLEHILFPQDPERDAPQIISDLRAIFPPEEGHYVFGPLAKIVGPVSQPLLQARLGLVLELPGGPLILLGHIEALIPVEKQIVKLKLDILGILDFSQKRLEITSTIYDSYIAGFPLSGDMAMRLAWGDRPEFVFSIGGFHPRFQPPPGFPPLKRLTVCMDNNDDVRLTIQVYLAVTPNTFQIGASAELVAGGKYNVHGWLSFDALIEFSPFRFRVDISAGVELRRRTTVIASVRLKGVLEGPAPWRVRGKACLSLLFFSVCVPFDRTFGEAIEVLLTPLDLAEELRKAVADPRNWSAELPPDVQRVVTAAAPKLNAPAVLVDPMGSASLHQRVAPLNFKIEKFAEAKVAGPGKYSITKVTVGGQPVTNPPSVTDFFAPGQFLYLSEEDKFSRASFEIMDAGVKVASNAVKAGNGIETEVVYETKIVDAPSDVPRRYNLSGAGMLAMSERGASALGAFNTTGARAFALDPRSPVLVGLIGDEYVVVSADDLSRRPDIIRSSRTKTAAQIALDDYLLANPQERGRLQVVPLHEI
jgi:hypothetical protein